MAGHRRTPPRDAWLAQVTATKRISDAVRALLLHMGYATDESGRRLMDEQGFYRAGHDVLAEAFGISKRSVTRRIGDAEDARVLRRVGGGKNGQKVIHQALVFAVDQPGQGDTPCHPGRTAEEIHSRVTPSSTLGVTPPVTLAPGHSEGAEGDTPCHPYDARTTTDDQGAGSAPARRTAGQRPGAATTDDELPEAVQCAVRQDGVEQADHDGTGGTAAQPGQASPAPGCPQHPGARTVTTPKRTLCIACERERRETDRLRREADARRGWGLVADP